jgi:prophage antirepressor-like protein
MTATPTRPLTRANLSIGFAIWRRRHNITQEVIANLLGITRSAVSCKEALGQRMSLDQIEKLERAYPGAYEEIIAGATLDATLPAPTSRRPAAGRRPVAAPVPEAAPEPANVAQLVAAEFEGHNLTGINYKDAPAFIAKEIGAVLGYADDGKSFVNRIRGEWVSEFVKDVHYHMLEGDELRATKSMLSNSARVPCRVDPRVPSLLLLTEAGVWLAIQKTEKPIGVRLRRYLSDEVLPKLGRGQPVPASAPAVTEEPAPVAPLPMLDPTVDRAREMRLLAKDIRRKGSAADQIDQLHLRAARLLLGEPELVALVAPAAEVRPAPVPTTESESEITPGDWRRFVQAWSSCFGCDFVTVQDLMPIVDRLDLFRRRLLGRAGHGRASVVGRIIQANSEIAVDGLQPLHRHSARDGWVLVQVQAK